MVHTLSTRYLVADSERLTSSDSPFVLVLSCSIIKYAESYNYIVEPKLIVPELKRFSYIKLVNRWACRVREAYACKRNDDKEDKPDEDERRMFLTKDRASKKREGAVEGGEIKTRSENRSIEAE